MNRGRCIHMLTVSSIVRLRLKTRRISLSDKKRRSEAGQALVLAAAALTVLTLAAGLAVDLGYLRYQRRRAQSAADGAAIAAAAEMGPCAGSLSCIQAAAFTDASSNGFKDSSLGGLATVTVNNPPASGPNSGNNSFVEVIVSQAQPTYFMRAVGINSSTISARAVAKTGSGPNCMYALGPASDAISSPFISPIDSNVTANCGVIAGGGLSEGHQSDHFTATSVGLSDLTGQPAPQVSPAPQKIVPPADPFMYLQSETPGSPGTCPNPSGPALNYTGPNVTVNPGGNSVYVLSDGNFFVNPGIYACGIEIIGGGSNGTNVVFSPGTYILGSPGGSTNNVSPFVAANGSCTAGTGTLSAICPAQTALVVSGPGNNLTARGVTFYNANGSIVVCAATPLGNDVTGCSDSNSDSVNLTAPTDGTYAGILFYQDAANASQSTITGSDDQDYNNTTLIGSLYFPAASLSIFNVFNAQWQDNYMILDAYKLLFYGTVDLGSTYQSSNFWSLTNGSPVSDAVLVE